MRGVFNSLLTCLKSKAAKYAVIFLAVVCVLLILSLAILNMAIISRTEGSIYAPNELSSIDKTYDCILILGAGVRSDGTPTPMLRDRLISGIEAYRAGRAPLIVISGDSENAEYRETDAMEKMLTDNGVPSKAIICDGYGLSTYESIWRIKKVYGFDNILIVTQKYHLHRAIYLAEKMGVSADGYSASLQKYSKQIIYSSREFFARVKDLYYSAKLPDPKYTEKW